VSIRQSEQTFGTSFGTLKWVLDKDLGLKAYEVHLVQAHYCQISNNRIGM